MNLTLYQNNSDNIVVNKSLTTLRTLACKVVEPCSVERPAFILEGYTHCNYCYADTFGKFYYIDEIVYLDGNRFEYRCHEDVLYTYRQQILGTNQHIVRQQSLYNLYLEDPRLTRTAQVQKQVRVFNAPSSGWLINPNISGTERSYVLNTM